ncbi:L,D-transpeptidase family protein [Verrucomicrobium sp. BvORR106]|uniref:L,D-transpeptidase n=1 Tax=Verrucomicrobium sp. BvORR106 TaxID=1403819 RepID=UPI00068DF273|nr:L,D-transpeptidase family protein [Verrucomicrobium sp. BvORR106]
MRKLNLSFRSIAASWTLKTGALLALAVALGLSSCATGKRHQKPAAEPAKFVMYHWEGDGVQGDASIVIYLDTQKAEFYRGKKLVGWTYVATGKPSHPTPAGNFRIIEKTPDKISNLYGKLLDVDGKVVDSDFNLSKEEVPEGHQFSPARMPMFQRLTNDGVGLHVGPIPRPGATASHGCIRVPRYMAQKFFANTTIGTPVTILAKSPDKKD